MGHFKLLNLRSVCCENNCNLSCKTYTTSNKHLMYPGRPAVTPPAFLTMGLWKRLGGVRTALVVRVTPEIVPATIVISREWTGLTVTWRQVPKKPQLDGCRDRRRGADQPQSRSTLEGARQSWGHFWGSN